jgi:hypothetical protein
MVNNEHEFKVLKLKYSIAEYSFWLLFMLFYVLIPLGYLYFRYFLPVASTAARVSGLFFFAVFIAYLIFNKQLKDLIAKMDPSIFRSILMTIPKILPLFLVVGALTVAELKVEFVPVLRTIFTNIFVSVTIGVIFYVVHEHFHNKKKKLITQYTTTSSVAANNQTLVSELEKKIQDRFDKINKIIIK